MNKKLFTLKDLLILKIQALYDIESEIVKALPKLAKNATDPDLKEGLLKHLEETENQVERLERIFSLLDEKPKKTKVEAIRGLAKDGEWVTKANATPEAKDAAIIAAAQYVEHYEMAGYGSALEWAKVLDESEIAEILEEILNEEKAADEKLNDLAMGGINAKATSREESEEEM